LPVVRLGRCRPVRAWKLACLLVTAVTLTAACASNSASQQKPSGPVLFGFDVIKSGTFAGNEINPFNGAMLAIDQLNASGGVLGRTIKTESLDNKADPVQTGVNAQQLLSDGAVAMQVTCDLDIGGPGAVKANAASVPVFSCAGDPHFGDTKTIGPYAFQVA